MLLRFKFSNYRSFRSEQELSLVAGPLNDHSEGVFEIPGINERVLPVAAIYGANASGKTTVLRALQFMNRVIRQSHRLWEPGQAIPLEPFAGEGPETPTRFVVDFVYSGIRHQYGFALNSSTVLEEWLHVYPKGKRQTWFSRKTGKPILFSEKLAGENRVIEQLTRNTACFYRRQRRTIMRCCSLSTIGSGTRSCSSPETGARRLNKQSRCARRTVGRAR